MRNYFSLLLVSLFIHLFSYGQDKQDDYIQKLATFNKVVQQNPEQGKAILMDVAHGMSAEGNDSLLAAWYNGWGTYYRLSHQPDSAIHCYELSAHIGISHHLYAIVSAAYYNKGEVLSVRNNIDSAIVYAKLAMEYARKAQSGNLENMALVSLARKLRFKGDFRQSNEILFKALEDIPDSSSETMGVARTTIAMNYDDLHHLDQAEKSYLLGNVYLKRSGNKQLISNNIANLVDLYNRKHEYEKALVFADSIIYYSNSDNSRVFYNIRKANAYRGLGKFDMALKHIQTALDLDKKLHDDYGYTLDLILKGQIYRDKQDFERAFLILSEAKTLFRKNDVEDMLMEQQLYRDYIYCYLKIKNPSLAVDFTHFRVLTDSLTNQSVDKNLAELQTKYNATKNEARLAQQGIEIEKQKTREKLSLAGGGIIIFLLGSGFVWYRNAQKRRDLQTKNTLLNLHRNIYQVEIAQLNQQLDPHEIKNLLAGISPEIQEKAPNAYRKMIKLLNITKSSLNNHSLTESVAIQVQQVQDYLYLMKNVLSKPIDYAVDVRLDDAEKYDLPRLILKNLVENAVKHGVNGTEKDGDIKLAIGMTEDMLRVSVSDNGQGMKEKISDSGIGLSTYVKLFKTLNQKNKSKAEMVFRDNHPGTTVEINIPVHYLYS